MKFSYQLLLANPMGAISLVILCHLLEQSELCTHFLLYSWPVEISASHWVLLISLSTTNVFLATLTPSPPLAQNCSLSHAIASVSFISKMNYFKEGHDASLRWVSSGVYYKTTLQETHVIASDFYLSCLRVALWNSQ